MRVLWAPLMAVMGVAACQAEPQDETARGHALYQSYCAGCHGAQGEGTGKLADGLPVAPPDLTLLTARNGGRFPREDVMAQIYGYPSEFHARIMPEFGPLLEGDNVTWTNASGEEISTPRALLQLSAYLESLQKSP